MLFSIFQNYCQVFNGTLFAPIDTVMQVAAEGILKKAGGK